MSERWRHLKFKNRTTSQSYQFLRRLFQVTNPTTADLLHDSPLRRMARHTPRHEQNNQQQQSNLEQQQHRHHELHFPPPQTQSSTTVDGIAAAIALRPYKSPMQSICPRD